MGSLFTTVNGRLKIGRITLVVFFGVILLATLLFKVAKPIDQVAVVVKHVFEPQQKPQVSTEQKKGAKKVEDGKTKPMPPPSNVDKQESETLNKGEVDKITTEATVPTSEQQDAQTALSDKKQSTSLLSEKIKAVDQKKHMVTVDKQQYMRLYKDWRKLGKPAPDDQKREKVSLQVENLRQVYDLFQMKPVVKTKGVFIDLENNTRIPEEALEQYSSTIFVVDEPWDKWGEELKAAGFKHKDTIDVRYYMYGFVRDAIYARARKAFMWSRERGAMGPKTRPSDADVFGRAFVINQDGGGKFGVFVPVILTLKDGSSFNIPPACFQGERDVDTLMTAGLL